MKKMKHSIWPALALCALVLILCPASGLAEDTYNTPYLDMVWPDHDPVLIPVEVDTRYVVIQGRNVPIYPAPDDSQEPLAKASDGLALQVMGTPVTYEGYTAVRMPLKGMGFIKNNKLRDALPEEIPAYAVDTSTKELGYIYVAATGSAPLIALIDQDFQRMHLRIPQDGRWYPVLLTVGAGTYDMAIYESGINDEFIRHVYYEMLGELTPPGDRELALLSSMHTNLFDNEKLVAYAQQLCQGADSDWERFTRIRDALYKNANYSAVTARNILFTKIPEPEIFLKRGNSGICSDYAAYIAVACRAVGIPCQHVYGINPKTQNEHAWNLVWLDDQWYLVDVTAEKGAGKRTYVPTAPEEYIRKDGYWDGFH